MIVGEAGPRYAGLRVTREQYLDLPDDGFSYTMMDGVLQMAPSADSRHASLHARLTYRIQNSLEQKPTGKLYVELDVFLPDGGDVVRPDLSYVRTENLGIVLAHIHGAPDLVVEILSPSTRDYDLGGKAERYAKCGVREYWVVDPEKNEVLLLKNSGTKWVNDESKKSDIFANFALSDWLLSE